MNDDGIPVRVIATAADGGGQGPLIDLAALGGHGHAFGCGCCQPRSALGRELGRLFSARARGEVAFFHAVAVVAPSADAVARLIAADPVAAARFRLDPG